MYKYNLNHKIFRYFLDGKNHLMNMLLNVNVDKCSKLSNIINLINSLRVCEVYQNEKILTSTFYLYSPVII